MSCQKIIIIIFHSTPFKPTYKIQNYLSTNLCFDYDIIIIILALLIPNSFSLHSTISLPSHIFFLFFSNLKPTKLIYLFQTYNLFFSTIDVVVSALQRTILGW